MDLDGIGYARELQAERAAILANVAPHHRAKLRGWAPRPVEAKAHQITVNLKTGERTVEQPKAEPAPAPAPNPAHRYLDRYARPRGAAMRVISLVAEAWDTLPYVLTSRNQSNRAAYPRFACYWLMYARVNLSTNKIGHFIGRDHTTILEGIKRAKHLFDHDPDWRRRYDAVVAKLEEGSRP
tara:strand:- start:20084 stop:20629 length:546 start_codon:yes stop_codon:yes gene_type:complete